MILSFDIFVARQFFMISFILNIFLSPLHFREFDEFCLESEKTSMALVKLHYTDIIHVIIS